MFILWDLNRLELNSEYGTHAHTWNIHIATKPHAHKWNIHSTMCPLCSLSYIPLTVKLNCLTGSITSLFLSTILRLNAYSNIYHFKGFKSRHNSVSNNLANKQYQATKRRHSSKKTFHWLLISPRKCKPSFALNLRNHLN